MAQASKRHRLQGKTRRLLTSALRPMPGRRLPAPLRAANVGALARQLSAGLEGADFRRLLQKIDGGCILHPLGEVELYFDDTALTQMLEAIRSAQQEVLIQAFIFEEDRTGTSFQEELVAAARRGVRVAVLADAFGSLWTRQRFWNVMKEAGAEVHLFNRFSRLRRHLYRDHRKILVVDRRVAFTGGMNIADEWGSFRPRAEDVPWRDTQVRVTGNAAWEMPVVFLESWEEMKGTPLPATPQPECVSLDEPAVLVLDSRPGRGHHETAAVLAAIIGAARKSVWITNAYFAPGYTAAEILGEAAESGLDVRLLLPGMTDVQLVRHAGHGYFSDLMQRGVRIFEYQPAILHAKSLVADGLVSVIGSSNLDFRSFRFNSECNLVFLDEGVGQKMNASFEQDLADSVEIDRATWSRRPLHHRVGDALARMASPLL